MYRTVSRMGGLRAVFAQGREVLSSCLMIDEGPSPEDIERFGGDGDFDEDVITCPSCGAEVWHEVSVCPECRIPIGAHSGRRSPQQKYFQDRTTVLVIVLVLAGLIISYVVCGAIF